MDQRAVIDVICKAGLENLATEIGALLGQEVTCSNIQLNLTTKADLFSNPAREKTALARISVSGDQDGGSYLLTRISAAAILGGTLIMLPEDMIEENAKSGKLDGELNDAFGEVANIIAGVFTQAFVDKYSKNIRFIKKTVEDLAPAKIDQTSDEPFPPGQYYVAACDMALADRDLGPLELVVPAAVFELDSAVPEPAESAQPQPATAQSAPENAAQAPSSAGAASPASVEPPAAVKTEKPSFADAKKLADVVFNATISQAGEEVGALLGHELTCDDVQLLMTSKADFFTHHCIETSILTHLQVTGDREGQGYLLAQLPDAVTLGGTLIMLPEEEIANQKNAGRFDGEVADSFGEIVNILAGSLTQVFLDRYPRHLRFIKTDSETVVPTKVGPASAQPFAEGSYYLVSFAIHMQGHELNRIQLLFPAAIFDLETAVAATAGAPATAATDAEGSSIPAASMPHEPAPGEWGGPPLPETGKTVATPETAAAAPAATAAGEHPSAHPQPPGSEIVLLISDQQNEAESFAGILSTAGYECRRLSFQDEVKEYFQQHRILGIFLIMAQVGEKGFAAAIKLQSAGKALPPLIFAGPEWTKSAVLRAVKYGAKDILVMPASGDEIQDKVSRHIKKAS